MRTITPAMILAAIQAEAREVPPVAARPRACARENIHKLFVVKKRRHALWTTTDMRAFFATVAPSL